MGRLGCLDTFLLNMGNGAPGAGFKKNEIKFPKSVFFVG